MIILNYKCIFKDSVHHCSPVHSTDAFKRHLVNPKKDPNVATCYVARGSERLCSAGLRGAVMW